jgi:hypothetical protein
MGCSCKSGNKDQSPKEVGEYLTTEHKAGRLSDDEPVGVAVFLVPDPVSGPLRYRSIPVAGLTYHDAGLRALACAAFKWFPYGMALDIGGVQTVIDDNVDFAKVRCRTGPCNDTAPWCGDPRTCFCSGDIMGWGWCVKESDTV